MIYFLLELNINIVETEFVHDVTIKCCKTIIKSSIILKCCLKLIPHKQKSFWSNLGLKNKINVLDWYVCSWYSCQLWYIIEIDIVFCCHSSFLCLILFRSLWCWFSASYNLWQFVFFIINTVYSNSILLQASM